MKLIFRVPNWVGDAVMAIPAVDCARAATGADHVAVMARKATASLYKYQPDVDRIVEIDDKSSPMFGPKRAADFIKDDGYDVGVIFPPSFSSALIFKLAGVTGRIGHTGDKRSLLLTHAVPVPPAPRHRTESYLDLIRLLTGKNLPLTQPRLYLSPDDISAGERHLARHHLAGNDCFVAMAPRAIAESRRWGCDNYGRLAKRIADEFGCRIVLIGVAADRAAGDEVAAFAPERIVNLCGRTSLLEAAAILSSARVFVGNDSGLAHLAAATGCPVVVLSGADNPSETSPICEKKTVLIKDIDCISCVRNVCPQKDEAFMKCMTLITVDEVFDATRVYIVA